MVDPLYKSGDKMRLKPGLHNHYKTIDPWKGQGAGAIVTIDYIANGFQTFFKEVHGWSPLDDFETPVEQDPDNISVDLFEDVPSPVEQLKVIFKSHNIEYDGNNLVDAVTQLSTRNKQNLAAFEKLNKVYNQFAVALDNGFYPKD